MIIITCTIEIYVCQCKRLFMKCNLSSLLTYLPSQTISISRRPQRRLEIHFAQSCDLHPPALKELEFCVLHNTSQWLRYCFPPLVIPRKRLLSPIYMPSPFQRFFSSPFTSLQFGFSLPINHRSPEIILLSHSHAQRLLPLFTPPSQRFLSLDHSSFTHPESSSSYPSIIPPPKH